MRRLLSILLLTACGTRGADSDFGERLARFHQHYNAWMRKYLGCPNGAAEVEQCKPELSVNDASEFLAARKEAKGLFGL